MHSQFAQDNIVSQNKELADNFKQYGKQNAKTSFFFVKSKL